MVYRPSSYLKIPQLSVGGLRVSYEVHGPFDLKRLHEKGASRVYKMLLKKKPRNHGMAFLKPKSIQKYFNADNYIS